jgi:hypothetical protein
MNEISNIEPTNAVGPGDKYSWVYWLYYFDRTTGDPLLYIGSSFRDSLNQRIREHEFKRGPCQVVFAAKIPRATAVETAMQVVLSPYRHRINPDSFHVSLEQAYLDLLPLLYRQSDRRVLH